MNNFSYINAIPYLIVYSILVIAIAIEFKQLNIYKRNPILYTIVLFILWIFLGFRGYVSTDFISYCPWFEELPTIWEGKFLEYLESSTFEPGFVIYTILCKSIYPNYFIWNILSTFIDLYILHWIFKKYSYYYILPFLIFMTMGSAVFEFNILRNAKAIFIFLLAIPYIKSNNPIKYFSLIIISCLFHISSIVYIPLYWILNKRWNKKIVIVIVIVGLVLTICQVKYVIPIFSQIASFLGEDVQLIVNAYIESDLYNRPYSVGLGYIERFITMTLVFITYDKWVDRTGNKYIFPNMYILYFVMYTYLSEFVVAMERLSYLFIASYWIFYPQLLYMVKKRYNKYILFFFIIILFGLKLAQQTSSIHLKYDNILFGIESYDKRKQVVMDTIE